MSTSRIYLNRFELLILKRWCWKSDWLIPIRNRNGKETPIAPLISTTRSTRARRGRDLRSAKIMRGFRSSMPRRDADGMRRHSSFLAVWYHVPCWLRSNTHTHTHTHHLPANSGGAALRIALCYSVSGGAASTDWLCPRADATPDLRR